MHKGDEQKSGEDCRWSEHEPYGIKFLFMVHEDGEGAEAIK